MVVRERSAVAKLIVPPRGVQGEGWSCEQGQKVDNSERAFLLDIVTQEARDVRTTQLLQGWQPATRSLPPLETADHPVGRRPSAGRPDRHGRLDGDGVPCPTDPRQEAQELNCRLGKTLEQVCTAGRKLRRHAIVAHRNLCRLQQTMADLLPQIRLWLRTGRVAAGKIINYPAFPVAEQIGQRSRLIAL